MQQEFQSQMQKSHDQLRAEFKVLHPPGNGEARPRAGRVTVEGDSGKKADEDTTQARMLARLTALEAATGNPDRGTGVFDDLEVSDVDLIEQDALTERIMRARPGESRHAAAQRPAVTFEATATPNAGDVGNPLLQALLDQNTLLTRQLTSLTERAPSRESTAATARPKVKGAQAQLEQDDLLDQLETSAGAATVIKDFDDSVRRLSHRIRTGANDQLDMDTIASTWRSHAPLAENRTLVRVSEALLHVLGALRSHDVQQAEARVCLLLAAIDQASRDKGVWGRAQVIGCAPEPNFNLYKKRTDVPEAERLVQSDDKSKLGSATVFCSRQRAANARAVVLEQSGALNK